MPWHRLGQQRLAIVMMGTAIKVIVAGVYTDWGGRRRGRGVNLLLKRLQLVNNFKFQRAHIKMPKTTSECVCVYVHNKCTARRLRQGVFVYENVQA